MAGTWEDILSGARTVSQTGRGLLLWEDLRLELVGGGAQSFRTPGIPTEADLAGRSFASAAEFAASGLARFTDSVRIGDVLWHRRDGEPPHAGFKIEADGSWWSPDYLVVAAAGQSNMPGSGTGGDMTLSGNVVAFDHIAGRLIRADYALPPAGGDGVRSGTALRNNLFFPFAEGLAEAEGRPVLVIARPVSGSRIDSWLESSGGANWAAFADAVSRGLAAAGAAKIDAFLWHQGESDFPVPAATYAAKFLAFVAQVRAADWAGADMPFLAGELSRLGLNFAQNAALQSIEVNTPDPRLSFVSSVGLTSADPTGVHFDGAALNLFGRRYLEAYLRLTGDLPPEAPNSAPTLAPGAEPPLSLTLLEGEDVRLALAPYFADAEGDALSVYGYLDRRRVQFTRAEGGDLLLRPGFNAAGTYGLTVYATDGRLDGASFRIALTVLDRAPGVQVHQTRDFGQVIGEEPTLAAALSKVTQNRGIDILSPGALAAGTAVIGVESLTIRALADVGGDFALGPDVLRLFTRGEGRFDMTGNALDNLIEGNAAANRILGGAGRDRLHGFGGADRLEGGAGDDTLFGGDGDDLLSGDSGRDHAFGGAGADSFLFRHGDDALYIRDYERGLDRVALSGFDGIASFADLQSAALIRASGSRTVIDLPGHQFLLEGIAPAHLSADDFLFL